MTESIFVQSKIYEISPLIEAEEEMQSIIRCSLNNPFHIVTRIIDTTIPFIFINCLVRITLSFGSTPIVFFYNTLFLFRIITLADALQYLAHIWKRRASLWVWLFLLDRLRGSITQNIKIGGEIFIAETYNQLFRYSAFLNRLFDIVNLTANFSKVCSLCAFPKHSVFISLNL